MASALPMLSTYPALPIESIEPAPLIDRVEPALLNLKILLTLNMLPTLL
jgi:hypothetical protein